MSGYYGWTYARRLNPLPRKRNPKPNRYQRRAGRGKRLKLNEIFQQQDWSGPLGRIGRLMVMIILLALSLAVLGKEQTLRAEVTGRIVGWWQEMKTWIGRTSGGSEITFQENIQKSVSSEETNALPMNPIAMVLDKNLFILDQTGTIWPLPNETIPGDLPVITGLVVREEPGDLGVALKTDVDMAFIRQILAVPYIEQISEIHIGSREGVVLYTRDAIKILLRNNRHLDRDLKRLGAVIGDIRVKDKKIALVDLRYNQHVVVRPKRRR